MSVAIGGPLLPPSHTYFYNSYEVDIEHNGKVRTIVENILIQTTVKDPYVYIINVLTGDYTTISTASDPRTIGSEIDKFLKTTYPTRSFNIAELKPIVHAGIKEDYLFNYFLERCNPIPILPVDLEQPRYFIKAEIEDEDEDEGGGTTYNGNEIFNQSAFEDDVEAPQTLISQCTYTPLPTRNCKFIDPILGTSYDTIFRTITYIEKSKEDYDKIIDRLKPISIPESTNRGSLNASIIEKLGPVFDVNNKPVAKVIDVIQENFGKHISLDVQLKALIDNPLHTNKEKLLTEVANVKASATPPVPLLTQISDDENSVSNEYFKIISFLRSYIDLYHDIENYSTEYCTFYLAEFIHKLTDAANKTFLREQIAIIDASIFTRTGNISQERCREQIERIADLFIRYLHALGIATNPEKKESAFVMQASIDNPVELKSLIDTITADGVTGFYVESANNNIGEILVKAPLQLYNLTIGEWDAGSGFSGKKLKPKPTIIQVGPAAAGSEGPYVIPNMAIDMFGLFRVEVSPDNKTLIILYGGAPFISINPLQKLSVNKLLIAAGKLAIRGTEDTNPAPLKFTFSSADAAAFDAVAPKGKVIIPLKPWTDLVQIKTISGSKILTIIYDTLCETTARIYGLYHVLLCQGKILTYYSYNINSRHLTPDKIQQRILLRYFINKNAEWIKKYLGTWFNQRITTLIQLIRESYDPILFFISKAFINRYIVAKDKSFELVDQVSTVDIKSIPDTLDKYIESVSSSGTLLADLSELHLKFKTAIDEIESVGARGNKEFFLNAYKKTQQLIINTFKTGDDSDKPITLRAMVASTFAYYFIKNPRYSRFLTKLDDIKRVILHEQYPAYTRPVLNKIVGVSVLVNGYNRAQFNASLSIIKVSQNEAVRNIVDIQIAIQTLLTQPPPNYLKYLQQVSTKPIDSNPDYSFDNVIGRVTTALNSVITSGTYFGGNKRQKKLSKTRKQKRTKRKTYKKRK